MNYKVRLALYIYNRDQAKVVFMAKSLTMPFVPFIGLSLGGELGICGPIISVSWSNEDQSFTCSLESHESECDDGSVIDMDYLISEARDNGWRGGH